MVIFSSYIWAALAAFTTASIMAFLIAKTASTYGLIDDAKGVQKVHTQPTPRIGGVAIALGLLVGWLFLPQESQGLWGLVLIGAIPAFASGLLEDITRKVSPKWRLIATLIGGLLFYLVSGYGIDRLGWGALNWIENVPVIIALLTMFGFAATANATNLIDGFHGLASASVICMAMGLGAIAWQVGDMEILGLCIFLSCAVFGFFTINYPFGKIFLGDAGAYTLGSILAALGIALIARHDNVSPWALLVCFGYPAIETGFSIYRRMRRKGVSTTQPDGVHFHKLVWRAMARPIARHMGRRDLSNALTLYFLFPLVIIGPLMAALLYHRTLAAIFGLCIVLIVYVLVYRVVSLQHIHSRIKKKSKTARLVEIPLAPISKEMGEG